MCSPPAARAASPPSAFGHETGAPAGDVRGATASAAAALSALSALSIEQDGREAAREAAIEALRMSHAIQGVRRGARRTSSRRTRTRRRAARRRDGCATRMHGERATDMPERFGPIFGDWRTGAGGNRHWCLKRRGGRNKAVDREDAAAGGPVLSGPPAVRWGERSGGAVTIIPPGVAAGLTGPGWRARRTAGRAPTRTSCRPPARSPCLPTSALARQMPSPPTARHR